MADPSTIYSGYLKASRYSRIKDADLTRALKPYKLTLSTARKRKRTDAQLRQIAAAAVVKRYRLKKSIKPKA